MPDEKSIRVDLPELDAESKKLLEDAQTLFSDFVNARMRAGNLPGEPDNSPRGRAIERIEKVLEKYPDDPRPNYILGNILHSMGELPKAELLLSKVYRLNVKHFDLNRLLAEILLERRDFAGVESHIEAMMKIDKTRPEIYEMKAEMARLKKDYPARLSAIEKLLDMMPLDERLAIAIATTYANMKKIKEASKKLEEYLEQLPNSPEIHFHLANLYTDLDKPGDALPLYRRTLELNPDHNMARFELANLLDEVGKPKEALDLYREYMDAITEDSDACYNAAAVAERLDNHPLAIQYYLNFLRLTRNKEDFDDVIGWINDNASGYIDDGELQIELAHAYIEQEDAQTALEKLEIAREAGHNHRRANHLKGLAYQILGEHKTAVDCFKKAMEYDDDADKDGFTDDDILIAAGESFLDLESYPDAEETAREIIKGEAMKEDGYTLLGDVLLEKGDSGNARKQFKNALMANIFSFDGLFGLGEVLDATENHEDAATAFRLCLEINPNDEDTVYRLGMDYMRLGYQEWGKYFLNRYVNEFPDGEFNDDARKMLNA